MARVACRESIYPFRKNFFTNSNVFSASFFVSQGYPTITVMCGSNPPRQKASSHFPMGKVPESSIISLTPNLVSSLISSSALETVRTRNFSPGNNVVQEQKLHFPHQQSRAFMTKETG